MPARQATIAVSTRAVPVTATMEGSGESKRKRDQALGHPIRQTILELLRDSELGIEEIRNGIPNDPAQSVVAYHLGILRGADLIEVIGNMHRRKRNPPS